MEDKLKPCPFCGGAVTQWDESPYSIFCERCDEDWGVFGGMEYGPPNWNHRPIEDALRAENERLRAQWDAVPWAALGSVPHVLRTHPGDYELEAQIIHDWLTANAPAPE